MAMSKYTTGELAKLCGVTVRTVQYYDTRNLCFKEAFWANHTPKMRKLTCPKCSNNGLCVEVYSEESD